MATEKNLNFLIAYIINNENDDEIRNLLNKYKLSKDAWLIIIYELADADRFDLISAKMKDIFGDLSGELGYEILEKAIQKNCPPLVIYLIENGLRVRREDISLVLNQTHHNVELFKILEKAFNAVENLDNNAKSARKRK